MGMPAYLVLVRHGKSEGNVASHRARNGDYSDYQDARFSKRHSSHFRLVEEGRKQAIESGVWIKKNLFPHFDRYYASLYLRAMETAAYLELPDAVWFADFNLRERDWGDMDIGYGKEREARLAESSVLREINSFFWRPPNGESIAQVCIRVDRMLDTLHRECDGKRVIIVSHGELMWAWRVILERMTPEHYLALDESDDPRDHIDNGHILIYTRIDPHTGKMMPRIQWMKSISPSHPEASRDEWVEIVRPTYSNNDLLKVVQSVPQIVS